MVHYNCNFPVLVDFLATVLDIINICMIDIDIININNATPWRVSSTSIIMHLIF